MHHGVGKQKFNIDEITQYLKSKMCEELENHVVEKHFLRYHICSNKFVVQCPSVNI